MTPQLPTNTPTAIIHQLASDVINEFKANGKKFQTITELLTSAYDIAERRKNSIENQ